MTKQKMKEFILNTFVNWTCNYVCVRRKSSRKSATERSAFYQRCSINGGNKKKKKKHETIGNPMQSCYVLHSLNVLIYKRWAPEHTALLESRTKYLLHNCCCCLSSETVSILNFCTGKWVRVHLLRSSSISILFSSSQLVRWNLNTNKRVRLSQLPLNLQWTRRRTIQKERHSTPSKLHSVSMMTAA